MKACLIFIFYFSITTPLSAQTIILNKPLSESDPRYQYTYDLLSLVLEVTPEYGKSEIMTSSIYMTRDRSYLALKKGLLINVMAEASKPEWNANLLEIPIPIRKGIQGFRIFTIHERDSQTLKKVKNLQELKALYTGSGTLWSTRLPMEEAGFTVVSGSSYDGLFAMLSKGRFQTFGRGVNEAYKEIEKQGVKFPGLMIDESLMLHIPLHTYFYVSPQFPELAARIKAGLLRLIENKTFDRFFYKRHCHDILQAKLADRKIFEISNSISYQKDLHSIVPANFTLKPSDNFNKLCQEL